MRKKETYSPLLLLFLLICLVPTVGMLIFGQGNGGANEIKTEKPLLFSAEKSLNTDYFICLSDYVFDSFFLRRELISLRNKLVASVFNTSAEDGVILGKNGWLYYSATLDDYTGANSMTDREIFSVATNLRLINDYCRFLGMDFLFVVAPNKNSVYGDNMPNYGSVSETHDSQRLFSKLREQNVPYLDLFTVFKEQDEVLYFAHDSHWSEKGAALAADLINSKFGKNTEYHSGDFSETAQHQGDLFTMLYPSLSDDELAPVFGDKLSFTYGSGGRKPDSLTINTLGSDVGNLLVFRDSFGNQLYPYLADSFASARFSRSLSFDLAEAEN